ncbi:hypothetical protein OS493_013815 [Desmophyllum pertusum]|uniref:Uncharacterized protein n=1 Tax=Desmophyllum pertusum TaxID=174260 RepID=A0A9X0D427_9CNID|nr:hypothetical protein OS493_013815 [Desmophyllum pertusum]
MGRFESCNLGAAHFTHDKPLEAFFSQQSQAASSSNAVQGLGRDQRSPLAVAGPSCSSNVSLTSKCSWIREDDNREENNSSFCGLDSYSPQLVHPTKARAKRPGTRRKAKNRSNTASEQDTTKPSVALEAPPGPSCRGKEPLGDTLGAGPRTLHAITDSSKEGTSASCTKDHVSNLRARFEQMPG